MAVAASTLVTTTPIRGDNKALKLEGVDEADLSTHRGTDSMEHISVMQDEDRPSQLGGAFNEGVAGNKHEENTSTICDGGHMATTEELTEALLAGSASTVYNFHCLRAQSSIHRISDDTYVPTIKDLANEASSYDDRKGLRVYCHEEYVFSSVATRNTPCAYAELDPADQDSADEHEISIISNEGSEPSSESSSSGSSSDETLVDEEEYLRTANEDREKFSQFKLANLPNTQPTIHDIVTCDSADGNAHPMVSIDGLATPPKFTSTESASAPSSSICDTEEEDKCMAVAVDTTITSPPLEYAQPLGSPDVTTEQAIINKADKTDGDDNTASPYIVGRVLELKAFGGRDLSVTISRIYSLTMSPVMAVQFDNGDGPQEAVLKLYDRRFGNYRIPCGSRDDVPKPYKSQAEAAWQRYIREGLADKYFEEGDQEDNEITDDDSDHSELSDDDPDDSEESDDESIDERPAWEIEGEEEATYLFNMQRDYANEVDAYEELKDLQGKYIPKFLSSVVFDMPAAPSDLPRKYFQVTGLLIEKLDGFSLTNLVDELPEASPLLWQEIIQQGVDSAAAVNSAGILNNDCCPRNAVVVSSGEDIPRVYMIDFARTSFRECYRQKCHWKESGMTYDVYTCDCWKCEFTCMDNPGAIGQIMEDKVYSTKRQKLDIKYPQSALEVLRNGETVVKGDDDTLYLFM
jgi:hypothetical protein